MNLLEMVAGSMIRKSGETKKLSIPGQTDLFYDVYAIPLEYLYYNNQNGRINTAYKKYKAENGELTPESGNSRYNEIFEQFISESNESAMKDTLQSIKDKTQQEPGVVLADGRIIDGNRRFTALRKYQAEDGIPKTFNAIILPLDAKKKTDEKVIKELELDLQLGREERVNYDPIDRIFDVYNTIMVEKLMTAEEYKKASGAGNTKGINRDIRLAELIIKFIEIVSPGGNPIDKFYLPRDLKLDGPIEDIESVITKMKSQDKESVTDNVLTYLVVLKADESQKDVTRVMRELKSSVLKNPVVLERHIEMADDKVDIIIDAFNENPIHDASDIKKVISRDEEVHKAARGYIEQTERLVYKGKRDAERKKAVMELEEIRDDLKELSVDDFSQLTVDENLKAKDILIDITDILYKLKKDLKI